MTALRLLYCAVAIAVMVALLAALGLAVLLTLAGLGGAAAGMLGLRG